MRLAATEPASISNLTTCGIAAVVENNVSLARHVTSAFVNAAITLSRVTHTSSAEVPGVKLAHQKKCAVISARRAQVHLERLRTHRRMDSAVKEASSAAAMESAAKTHASMKVCPGTQLASSAVRVKENTSARTQRTELRMPVVQQPTAIASIRAVASGATAALVAERATNGKPNQSRGKKLVIPTEEESRRSRSGRDA
jgi:hypothetical protein